MKFNNKLVIFQKKEKNYFKSFFDGIEEEGIAYEVIKFFDEEIDYKAVPFNIKIYLDDCGIKVSSLEFSYFLYFKDNISQKKIKRFGGDIGRYIKGLPLKGDLYEG